MSTLLGPLFFCLLSGRSVAVESPLEIINNEISAIKIQMNSVQKTLITSVGLIQDQMTELSNEVTSKLESSFMSMDSKLQILDGKVNQVQDEAHVWDTLQHHVSAFSSLMKRVDDKINRVSRSQNEKFQQQSIRLDRLPDIELKLVTVSNKVDDIGIQLETVDTRLMSLQDKGSIDSDTRVFTMIQNIEAQLRNISMSRSSHRVKGSRQRVIHDGSPRSNHKNGRKSCRKNREILEDIQSKVDVVYDKSTNDDNYNSDLSSGPRFDFLRAQPSSSEFGSNYDLEPELDESENQFVKMFRKLATPLKKANKRLKEMEDMQGRFGNMITVLERTLQSSLLSIENKLNDLYTMSGEIFEQQNTEMERYSSSLAEILQCCKGHSGDFERFKASGSPVLANLDTWMVTWSASANRKFDRMLEQFRYNTNRLVTGHKELERILVEGIDRCHGKKFVIAEGRKDTTELTTAVAVTTLERIVVQEDLFYEDMEVEKKSESKDQIEVENKNEESDEPKTTLFKGCEDLRKSGERESKVFTVGQTRQINELHKDFNTRFCDQETSGGGWTVIQRRGDYGEPRVNFSRSWMDYKHGFGDLYGEFWFGNDYISKLSTEQNMMLRIDLEDHNGTKATAEYTTFRVDAESMDYRLWVGGYSGNATDSLSNHNGYKFSTMDRNNDQAPLCCPCVPAYGGGWWFYSCFESNLNGEYFMDPLDNGYYRGIIWELWLGDYSLKSAKMMIRPRDWSDVIPVPPDP